MKSKSLCIAMLSLMSTVIVLFSLGGITVFADETDEPEIVASGYCGDGPSSDHNVSWTLDSNGLLTISGTRNMKEFSSSTIPWKNYCEDIEEVSIIEGVTNIGSNAFHNCTSLMSITIPDSVTSIGNSAFAGCQSLASITIPNSVTYIDWMAFYNCTSLTSITIPNSVKYIGNSAFSGCQSLTSIVIPDSVTDISYDAFLGCKALTSITIPDSVTSIGDQAFQNCTSLATITIPDSVTSIGDQAFYNCSNLTSINIPDSVTSIGNHAFHDCASLTTITIHGSVTNLGDASFYGCKALASIVIPDSVTSIGDSSFYGCSSLTSINMPDSLKIIGNFSFYGCKALTSIVIPDSVISIGNNAFSNCTLLSSITIPDSVTSIGNSAFSGCQSLTSITLSNSVTSIGDYTFGGCSSLASVTIPDSVTSIGDYALGGCSSLASVTIPDSVTSIGDHAFYNCTSLTTITNLGSITSINDNAFYNCSNLISITIPDSVTSIGSYAFEACASLTSVTIPDSVTSIGDEAFCSCTSLASVNIPNSVTGIGLGAFGYCTSLTSISIPNSVIIIEDYAFYGCESLTSIDIPNSVTNIGNNAFYECERIKEIHISVDPNNLNIGMFMIFPTTIKAKVYVPNEHYETYKSLFFSFKSIFLNDIASGYCGAEGNGENISWTLDINGSMIISGTGKMKDYSSSDLPWYGFREIIKEVTISKGVTSICDSAFYRCTSLASVTIPDSVTSIGVEAFRNCTSLTSVTIPDGVTSIGNNAFSSCASLTSIIIPDSVTSISNGAFSNCTSLASVTIPDSVTSIGNYAFGRCTSLASVTIPNSVTYIDREAFQDCSSLASITIPNSVTSIGDAAFRKCTSLTSVIIPNSVTCIDGSTFSGCSSLTSIEIPDGVTSIGWRAFGGCTSLASVSIPDSVTNIDQWAFTDCVRLERINIPASVVSIEEAAFENCENLKDVYFKGSRQQLENITIYFGTIDKVSEKTIYDVFGDAKIWFDDMSIIKTQPVDFYGSIGSTAVFSVGTQGEGIKYQWQVFKSGAWKNTSLAGYNTSKLSVEVLSSRDGMKFRCVVTDSNGNKDISDEAFIRVVASAVTITSEPKDFSGSLGETAKFEVVAEGEGLNYQWQVYKNGVWKATSLTGNKTDTLEVSIIESRDGMKFRCVVSDALGNTVISDEAKLTVNSFAITMQPEDYAGPIGSNAEFTVAAEGENLTYQWQVYKSSAWKNTSLTGNKTSELEVRIVESRNGMKFRCVVTDGNGKSVASDEVVLTVTVPAVTITSEPEDYCGPIGDTAVFTVVAEGEELTYQWQVYKSGVWKNTSLTGNKTSTLEVGILESRDGMKFRCVVTDINGTSVASNEAIVTVGAKPVTITSEPEDYSGPVGDVATFEIEAEGENLTYQWQVYKSGAWKNTSLPGNTSSSLDVEITEARDGMTFRCVVKDGNGNKAISEEATLTVAASEVKIITEPENYTGSIGDKATFEVVAEGEDLTYQWQVYKNGAWKNTSLAGNKTDTLEVEVLSSRDGMQFRCVVTDVYGNCEITDTVTINVI